jgi:acyl-CoA synthetase (AMP-forming)/AMP-acid ligase II
MFDDYIRFQAAMRGDAPAMVTKTGVKTFAEFEAAIRRAVQMLRPIEAEPGEWTSVEIESAYLGWVVIMALARLGIAATSRDSKVRWCVTDDGERKGEGAIFLSPDQVDAIHHGPEVGHFRVRPDPDVLGHVFRTSGTTGEPKRVGASWRTIEANVDHTLASHGHIKGLWCTATGITNAFGFNSSLAAWQIGNPVTAGLGAAGSVIASIKPRWLGAVPVQLQLILDNLPARHARWPMRIVTGGTSVPAALAERIRAELTEDVFLNYGCTEASLLANATLDLLEREPRAVGYPRPQVEVRIIDDDGSEVPTGETGRLCFRTGRVTIGYLDDPAMTAECYRDGWFHSRDLGRCREDGLLVLEGRVDDVMNLGGHKVLPGAIEEVALACDGVRDAAAFAIRTASGLDRCGIALVADETFDDERLRAALKGWLMRSQHYHLLRLDSLPRNAMGKVERERLRELLEGDEVQADGAR